MNPPDSALPLSFMERFSIFHLIVLASQPPELQFRFDLTSLIDRNGVLDSIRCYLMVMVMDSISIRLDMNTIPNEC